MAEVKLINCPACDKQISIEASVCPQCGQPISEEVKLSAKIKAETGLDKIKCPVCRKEINTGASACPECGQDISEEVRSIIVKQTSKSNTTCSVIIVGVLLLAVLGYCSSQKGTTDKQETTKQETTEKSFYFEEKQFVDKMRLQISQLGVMIDKYSDVDRGSVYSISNKKTFFVGMRIVNNKNNKVDSIIFGSSDSNTLALVAIAAVVALSSKSSSEETAKEAAKFVLSILDRIKADPTERKSFDGGNIGSFRVGYFNEKADGKDEFRLGFFPK